MPEDPGIERVALLLLSEAVNELLQAGDESLRCLPAEFDPSVYRSHCPDLRSLNDADLAHHYASTGAREGRSASTISSRHAFIDLIPQFSSLLEIGPFANPLRRGPNVKYFDVLPTELLRQRAKVHGVDPTKCPQIDYVSETGDLAVVTDLFDAALSAHVIEHQPDLIRHLRGVASVLKPGGRYYLAVPDKRFCFDHFIVESNIAEIVAAHARAAHVHDVQSVIEHIALTTHNDCARHWAGDHGEPAYKAMPARILDAVGSFLASQGKYVDVHAWQFTPESFRDVMQTLFKLCLSPLRVLRIYRTASGSNEFYAVLERTAQENVPLREDLPADFDEQQYLLANPDVAKAGVSAAEHYVVFGRREGRKLRTGQ